MKLKLGQIFWIRDIDCYGEIGRSDYECKVIGVKNCKFIDNSSFDDYLVEETRLNGYNVSFKSKESRTKEISFRYDNDEKQLKYWYVQNWPSEVKKWKIFDDKICLKKPKNLRKDP